MPVKWLALESLHSSVFNTKTDVWAFGIFLWEIFSLGQEPYPGMVADYSLKDRLETGYRMQKPNNATGYMYKLFYYYTYYIFSD